jgi:HSP20 family molecular chaperone IbpA
MKTEAAVTPQITPQRAFFRDIFVNLLVGTALLFVSSSPIQIFNNVSAWLDWLKLKELLAYSRVPPEYISVASVNINIAATILFLLVLIVGLLRLFGWFGYIAGRGHTERLIKALVQKSKAEYPPYEIEEPDDNNLFIVLHVGEYELEQLEIKINGKDITIYGTGPKSFTRTFILADWLVIKRATLAGGVLRIQGSRQVPGDAIINIPIQLTV